MNVARGLGVQCARCRAANAPIDTRRARLLHAGSRENAERSVISPWTRAYAYACARTNASCTHRRPRNKIGGRRSASRAKLVRFSNDDRRRNVLLLSCLTQSTRRAQVRSSGTKWYEVSKSDLEKLDGKF